MPHPTVRGFPGVRYKPRLCPNARHVLRGLEIVVPKAMHTHTARRARSEAARQADFNEFRHDIRANGCRGLGERD